MCQILQVLTPLILNGGAAQSRDIREASTVNMETIERILDLAAARGVAVTIAINLLPEIVTSGTGKEERPEFGNVRGRSHEGLSAAGVKALAAIASDTIDPAAHSIRSLTAALGLAKNSLYRDVRFREIFAQYQARDPTHGHYDQRTGELDAEF